MRRIRPFLTLLVFTFTLTSSLSIFAQQIVPGQLLVQIKAGVEVQDLIQEINASQQNRLLDHTRLLSKDLNLHLLSFDTLQGSGEMALALLLRHQATVNAQHNHYVSPRGTQAVPNDPGFVNQWGLENTGQNGGTPGADVSAVEAWDRTTGGPTLLGDTIVVAVIDDGFELNHEDLNYWQNLQEIPGNGLDDDQNGYIDDARGWNAYNSTGNLPLALHGTHVAGVIGARGNNGIGGSGMSWDVQIMPIGGSSGTEDIVLEAYGYALAQRKLYDQTQGQKGAYVVVTNSSFGVDNANPAQFPLWCAMYDTLGAHGILSVAASMNIGSNVEVSGDMPTRCTSDYLIAVTNTTPADTRNPSAAFGTTSVDLGAPGSGIYSTLPNNGYGFQTGTSFAAPFVSGTLALMFADACPAFMLNYANDPAQVALTLKSLLLAGVDTLGALSAEVLTSGRLNADKALQKLQDTCALLPSDCLPPYSPSLTQILDTAATFNWVALDSSQGFQIRYRIAGNTNWEDSTAGILPPFELTGLAPCVNYEWQVGTICTDGSVTYMSERSFRSEGCCEPPTNLMLMAATDSSLVLSWDSVFGGNDYSLRYRIEGNSNWINVLLGDTTGFSLFPLNPCTSYEIQVKVRCDTQDLGFSPSAFVSTGGCGACLDQEYCSTQGLDVNFEWIAGVEIGPLSQNSSADNGYIARTEPVFILPTDSLIPVTLTPGFSGPAFDETWRIWIDLDRDGVFTDSAEIVYESGPDRNPVNGVIYLPDTVEPGNTRMRVSMRFAGFTGNNRPVACGTFGEGETEDYCVWIQPKDTSLCPPPSFVLTDFIPGTDTLRVRWLPEVGSDSFLIRLEGLDGQPSLSFVSDTTALLVGNLETCSQYSVTIQPFCGELLGYGTEAEIIRSKGCGPCQDLGYCPSTGRSDSLWIERFELGDLMLSSGPNDGYGDFTDFSQTMKKDTGYALTLIAGYTGAEREVFWDIWIDWQGDGILWFFDRVGQATAMSGDTLRGLVSLPNGFVPGGTRLRVTVRDGQEAGVCELFESGEVEDYCVNLVNPVGIDQPDIDLKIYPNPAQDRLTISASQPITAVKIGDVMGRILEQKEVPSLSWAQLEVAAYPSGLYWVEVETIGGTSRGWVRVE